MARTPRSKTFAAVHETMSDLHAAGAIDDTRMREFDDLCLEPVPSAPALTFDVFKDRAGLWRWHLRSARGGIVAAAAQGYRSKRSCLAAIELVRSASSAPIAA